MNPKHNRFSTIVHVAQDWVVDENGNWLETLNECSQVTHGPKKGNFFLCRVCSRVANVEQV
jgi:hypothetical protein